MYSITFLFVSNSHKISTPSTVFLMIYVFLFEVCKYIYVGRANNIIYCYDSLQYIEYNCPPSINHSVTITFSKWEYSKWGR